MPDYRKNKETNIKKTTKNIFYYSIPERIGSYEYFVDEENDDRQCSSQQKR